MISTSAKSIAKHKSSSAPPFTCEVVCLAVVFLRVRWAICFVDVVQIVSNGSPKLALLVIGLSCWGHSNSRQCWQIKYRETARSVPSAEAVTKEDPRPPVLYLRSLKDDERSRSRLVSVR